MRTCTECGDPFEGRSNAAYCSAACRQKAYRKRNAPPVTASPAGDVDPDLDNEIRDMTLEIRQLSAAWDLLDEHRRWVQLDKMMDDIESLRRRWVTRKISRDLQALVPSLVTGFFREDRRQQRHGCVSARIERGRNPLGDMVDLRRVLEDNGFQAEDL